jgi:phospholipase/carboxylesterase
MIPFLTCLEIEPSRPANAAVIWMHGLGATSSDFEDVPPLLALPPGVLVRYVFPQAPSRPVTINGGWVMPAWYDITQLGDWEKEEAFATGRGQDEAGVRASEKQIRALIEREKERGIPAERIVLAGFSQGGAVALHTALRYEEKLAGVMVLSAGLLFADKLPPEAAPANKKTPILVAHGTFDPMVSVMVGKRTRHFLESHGYSVEWREYAIQHTVSLEEIQDIGRFLSRVLQPKE